MLQVCLLTIVWEKPLEVYNVLEMYLKANKGICEVLPVFLTCIRW